MKNRSAIRDMRKWCACVLFLSACGGRAVTIEGSAGSAATGEVSAGGTGSSGGGRANGGTGNVGRAGSGSAGVASGGAGNACDTTCPLLSCIAGTTLYYPPGACCPICQSNCAAPCPDIACASGYELQPQAGQCCPSCVPSTMLDCVNGQQKYQVLRAQLVSKYQYGCASAADCAAVAAYNDCESGCSLEAIWSGAVDNFNSSLRSAALIDCAACGPAPPLCLIPPSPVACNQGQCAFDSTLPK